MLGLVLTLGAGCDQSEPMCTDEFVTYTVNVQSPNGEPAESVSIEVRDEATGESYDVCEKINNPRCPGSIDRRYSDPGEYLIFHDGIQVSLLGSPVEVVGTKGNLSFSAEYVFRQGDCHVQKLEGPDQVTLRE